MAVEGIVANGVTEILKKLSSVVTNEITLVWDFKNELTNLQKTLKMILSVIQEAEKQQLSSEPVRCWMEELKAIAYDAEDILDDYSYELLKHHQKHEKKKDYKSKVRNIFSEPSFVLSWKLAHEIKKLNENFNKIAKCKNDLGLLTTINVVGSSSQHELMRESRETDSVVVKEWRFIGRDDDKSAIMEMLLEEDQENSSSGSKHVWVIPIVGMGGVGKTSLAQQVFNEEAIQNQFELKIWICVSHPFVVGKLWKNIANEIEIDTAAAVTTTRSLENAFRGKKFIMVLDDVWNESDDDWYRFKKPFMVGREGSRILVTSRSTDVATIMVNRFRPYKLGILEEKDCWNLFRELAFGYLDGAKETPNLMDIGKEMIKRCGGLPLAVVFLGSLMRFKKTEEEWEIIRDNPLWYKKGKCSGILTSLRLSYDHLPSDIKVCFSYCCLFPKDSRIMDEQLLISLWMAEGFVIESPEKSLEEAGKEVFQCLVSNFFLQDVDGEGMRFTMHDFVYDLARSVVGHHECLIVENAAAIDYISVETRRLSILVDLDDEEIFAKVLEALTKAKKLRTVFVLGARLGFDIGNCFKQNKRLRVLHLDRKCVTVSSGCSIGELKHLRYFNYFNRAALVAELPKGIGRLSFLHKLSEFKVGDRKKNKNANVIEELEGLNLLRGVLSINDLYNVRSGRDALRANLKEKKDLRSLNLSWRGSSLSIHNNPNREEAVLEGLRPHPNLRTLWIEGFKGSKLPMWIQEDSSSCLPNLVELTLDGCSNIEQVAGFGALPSLNSLTLGGMENLKCIGNEFYYSAAAAGGSSSAGGGRRKSSSSTASTGEASTATIPFPSLKKLSLLYMDSLKEWVVPPPLSTSGAATSTNCFHLLQELVITACPDLNIISSTTLPSLKVLGLYNVDGSAGAVETLVTNNLNSLTSLSLCLIPNFITLPRQGLMENNNTLLSLVIVDCPQFEGFFTPNNNEEEEEEGHDDDTHQGGGGGGGGQQLQQISQVVSSSSSSSLEFLRLNGCPAMRFYPNFLSLTSLQSLEIQECKESQSLPTCLSSSLAHLKICPVYEKWDGGFPVDE